jgi:thiol-disulfide isomerase/thioredoxin
MRFHHSHMEQSSSLPKALIAFAGIIIIGGAIYFGVTATAPTPMSESVTVATSSPDSASPNSADPIPADAAPAAPAARGGVYEPFSADKLSRAANGDVVLFFRAPWCPSCRALDANIKSNTSLIPQTLTILDVDYDTAQELRVRYGVTSQHTLVQVDANGEMIKRWQGGNTLAALIGEVE